MFFCLGSSRLCHDLVGRVQFIIVKIKLCDKTVREITLNKCKLQYIIHSIYIIALPGRAGLTTTTPLLQTSCPAATIPGRISLIYSASLHSNSSGVMSWALHFLGIGQSTSVFIFLLKLLDEFHQMHHIFITGLMLAWSVAS